MGVEVASSADAGVERGTLATAEGLLSGAMVGDVRALSAGTRVHKSACGVEVAGEERRRASSPTR